MPNFEAMLRGVSFRPIEAKAIVVKLQENDELTLEREPENEFDTNAIRVLHPPSGEFLGFVAKEIAADIAPLMDRGTQFTCKVGNRYTPAVVALVIDEAVSD
jgi:hypothetical protein